jgi:hypothetical protein
MAQQGKPDRQDRHPKPTGTSGRQSGNDVGDNKDTNRGDQTSGENHRRPAWDDEEESGLGNRTTNR